LSGAVVPLTAGHVQDAGLVCALLPRLLLPLRRKGELRYAGAHAGHADRAGAVCHPAERGEQILRGRENLPAAQDVRRAREVEPDGACRHRRPLLEHHHRRPGRVRRHGVDQPGGPAAVDHHPERQRGSLRPHLRHRPPPPPPPPGSGCRGGARHPKETATQPFLSRQPKETAAQRPRPAQLALLAQRPGGGWDARTASALRRPLARCRAWRIDHTSKSRLRKPRVRRSWARTAPQPAAKASFTCAAADHGTGLITAAPSPRLVGWLAVKSGKANNSAAAPVPAPARPRPRHLQAQRWRWGGAAPHTGGRRPPPPGPSRGTSA
jgi:hypothetical protein